MAEVVVTAAGVDTWSPCWYVHPDRQAANWLREHATVPSARGAQLLNEPVLGHRVGWFPSGLVFAEGHPDPSGALCPASELVSRVLDIQEALGRRGLPLPVRERPFDSLGAESEGFGGLRRLDATVNVAMPSQAMGLAALSGIAACARDAPGKAQVVFGADRAPETVYFRGHSGKAVLGRWYDKAVEALLGPRGTVLRGEDQRRWPKGVRRDPAELTAPELRGAFQRRFYPLWKATKGVTVGGPMLVVEKVIEAVTAGEIGSQRGRLLLGDTMAELVGRGSDLVKASTLRRSRQLRRELGVVLADGVLQEVEVDVHAVLEAALETDAWERRG